MSESYFTHWLDKRTYNWKSNCITLWHFESGKYFWSGIHNGALPFLCIMLFDVITSELGSPGTNTVCDSCFQNVLKSCREHFWRRYLSFRWFLYVSIVEQNVKSKKFCHDIVLSETFYLQYVSGTTYQTIIYRD